MKLTIKIAYLLTICLLALFLGLMFFFHQGPSSPKVVKILERTKGTLYQTTLENLKIVFRGKADSYRIQVSPKEAKLPYRSYIFNSDGTIHVFLAVAGLKPSTSTGMRSFILYPRKAQLDFLSQESDAGKQFVVRGSNGSRFIFDPTTADLVSINLLSDFKIKPLHPFYGMTEGDGLNLGNPTFGLVVDGGFRMGESPFATPRRRSQLKNSHGDICEISNEKLFSYQQRGNFQLNLFPTKGFLKLIQSSCETDFTKYLRFG